jgi:3-polyprenyl-4-hydroxybenzoate decarboxylase
MKSIMVWKPAVRGAAGLGHGRRVLQLMLQEDTEASLSISKADERPKDRTYRTFMNAAKFSKT